MCFDEYKFLQTICLLLSSHSYSLLIQNRTQITDFYSEVTRMVDELP